VVRTAFPDGQPQADADTTFLATFDQGPPFAADQAAGGVAPR